MTDDKREAVASGSDSPMTRLFRQLADAADAPDTLYAPVRIVGLAHQFEAAMGPPDRGDAPSDPPEDGEPPQP